MPWGSGGRGRRTWPRRSSPGTGFDRAWLRRGSRSRTLRALFALYIAICLGVIGWFGGAYLLQQRPALFAAIPAMPTYYRNCAAAHAAGVYSISRGAPGYRSALDADNDGRACEPYVGTR